MEKKEENKKDNKKEQKAKVISRIIMCIGLVIGLTVIGLGIIHTVTYPKKIQKNEARMDQIAEKIGNLNAEQSAEFKENGFSKEYYSYMTKIEKLQEEKSKLSSENFQMKHFSVLQFVVPGFFPIIFGFVFGTIVKNIIDPPTPGDLLQENFGVSLEDISKKMTSVDVEPEYKSLKCPNCGNNLDGEDLTTCKYCGATLEKVYKRKKKETK